MSDWPDCKASDETRIPCSNCAPPCLRYRAPAVPMTRPDGAREDLVFVRHVTVGDRQFGCTADGVWYWTRGLRMRVLDPLGPVLLDALHESRLDAVEWELEAVENGAGEDYALEKLARLRAAAELAVRMFERQALPGSGHFHGDDEHEAWAALTEALAFDPITPTTEPTDA